MYHSYPVAVKVINTDALSESALDQVSLLAKFKHPNVVLLMGTCLNNTGDKIYIVTEYAKSNLERFIMLSVSSIRPSLSVRLKMGGDILLGLNWLVSHKVIHLDLKLSNFLVFEDWTVKIGDLSKSIQKESPYQPIRHFEGTVKYSAPEVLKVQFSGGDEQDKDFPVTEKANVYTLGLIIWEVLTLKPLYTRPKEFEGKKGLARFIQEGNRPEVDEAWPPSLKAFFDACWKENPSERNTFQEQVSLWPDITTDVLCPDKYGREVVKKLWKKGKEDSNVSFEDFKTCFGEVCMDGVYSLALKKNQSLTKLLSIILCESTFDDSVSKERFCNLVGWFGPIDRENNCHNFFARLKDLMTQKFFHGFLGLKKATHLLKAAFETKKQQYYLVRFSEDGAGGFYLTFIEEDGKIKSEKIMNHNGKWYVESLTEEFDSWKKLIWTCKTVWNLKKVLADSPYDHILKKHI
eukprot:TRINITY_DN1752_c0_g1_i1.p1 TRINITY_DN1752_c0_g1~~TRINITY_DN1752_c0_g1_i1.p1  ORF type:complete len:462 (+),score=78.23 TRINITY_DN1752_c0_g1_i1:256-1641(+)